MSGEENLSPLECGLLKLKLLSDFAESQALLFDQTKLNLRALDQSYRSAAAHHNHHHDNGSSSSSSAGGSGDRKRKLQH